MTFIDPVALTALVISLVALLATTGQLLQQYFATADGYRQCLPSVMGRWGTMTKLRWRWREFRFETIFYVPYLSVGYFGTHRGSADAPVFQPLQGGLGKEPDEFDVHDTKGNHGIWHEDWTELDLTKTYILAASESVEYFTKNKGKLFPQDLL
jgi:hypothetical protein